MGGYSNLLLYSELRTYVEGTLTYCYTLDSGPIWGYSNLLLYSELNSGPMWEVF